MTKERLRQYRALNRERQQIRDRMEALEAAMYYPKPQRLTGMPSGHGGSDQMAAMVASHAELEEKYKQLLAELDAELLAIETAIETLDPTARTLLRYRYIDGLKWEEVCVRMNYSWNRTHAIHAEALKQLKEPGE